MLVSDVLKKFVSAYVVAITCISFADAADNPGRRIALVIGNGNYQQPLLPKLRNPPNDADDISKVLRNFGFEVIERKNQTLEGMNLAIAEFGSKIGGSEAALFFFAGHGIQSRNQNYLLPVNAKIDSDAAIPYQGINLNQILDEMDNGKSGANIVILDACRNNPMSGKFRSGQSRGLASPGNTPKGTVIIYATDPGNVASDGVGRNGLLTAGLLTAFKGKDLSLDGVLTVASAEVEQASGMAQTPYINGPKTLQKKFNFHVMIDPGPREIEKSFWNSIAQSTEASDYEAYLQKYPQGSYSALAENRLKKLKTEPKERVAGTTSIFDGSWTVSIACEDVQDKGKLVKGYAFSFMSEVKNGQLKGQLGQVGQPSSLTMVGAIQSDGKADLIANGLTGNPDTTMGQLSRGSPYSYRMSGTFSQTSGKAVRLNLRPCEATFIKN